MLFCDMHVSGETADDPVKWSNNTANFSNHNQVKWEMRNGEREGGRWKPLFKEVTV